MADYPDRADEPRHRSRRPHARLRNETVLKWVVPTVIGAIGCFGVLESWIWLRQRQHAKRLRQHQAYLDRRPARVKLHGYNTADRLVKESEFDEVVYELLPGLDVCGKYGEVIQTNTQGFRTNTLVENPIAFEPSAFDYAVGTGASDTLTCHFWAVQTNGPAGAANYISNIEGWQNGNSGGNIASTTNGYASYNLLDAANPPGGGDSISGPLAGSGTFEWQVDLLRLGIPDVTTVGGIDTFFIAFAANETGGGTTWVDNVSIDAMHIPRGMRFIVR